MSKIVRPTGDLNGPRGGVPAPGLRVLVVEDLPVNQQIVTLYMAAYGHTVDVAAHGEEAVRKLSDGGDYDVVLMDIQMPVMDGVTATRAIRALAGPVAAMPIVALTANVSTEECRSYIEAGMNGVAEKPIQIAELLDAMARAIDSRLGILPNPLQEPSPWRRVS